MWFCMFFLSFSRFWYGILCCFPHLFSSDRKISSPLCKKYCTTLYIRHGMPSLEWFWWRKDALQWHAIWEVRVGGAIACKSEVCCHWPAGLLGDLIKQNRNKFWLTYSRNRKYKFRPHLLTIMFQTGWLSFLYIIFCEIFLFCAQWKKVILVWNGMKVFKW